jgi:hypothetical protein
VARAKRTNRRAEARRRYRATLSEDLGPDEELDADGAADEEAPSTSRSRARPAAAAATARPARPSVIGALRAAFHPVDLRGDIAAIPSLVRHKSFFIPLAMIVAGAGAVAVAPGESIVRSLHPYFLAPPPVAPVFLAGFLALRASWLSGAILGLLSQVLYLPLLANADIQLSLTGGAEVLPLQTDIVVNYLLLGSFGGAFYAAAAAWYKRFLALANPNRAARAANRGANRPPKKGSNERPMLARRR